MDAAHRYDAILQRVDELRRVSVHRAERVGHVGELLVQFHRRFLQRLHLRDGCEVALERGDALVAKQPRFDLRWVESVIAVAVLFLDHRRHLFLGTLQGILECLETVGCDQCRRARAYLRIEARQAVHVERFHIGVLRERLHREGGSVDRTLHLRPRCRELLRGVLPACRSLGVCVLVRLHVGLEVGQSEESRSVREHLARFFRGLADEAGSSTWLLILEDGESRNLEARERVRYVLRFESLLFVADLLHQAEVVILRDEAQIHGGRQFFDLPLEAVGWFLAGLKRTHKVRLVIRHELFERRIERVESLRLVRELLKGDGRADDSRTHADHESSGAPATENAKRGHVPERRERLHGGGISLHDLAEHEQHGTSGDDDTAERSRCFLRSRGQAFKFVDRARDSVDEGRAEF